MARMARAATVEERMSRVISGSEGEEDEVRWESEAKGNGIVRD